MQIKQNFIDIQETTLVKVSNDTAKQFHIANSLSSLSKDCQENLGLLDTTGRLISLMSFCTTNEDIEVVAFTNLQGHIIKGAEKELFTIFALIIHILLLLGQLAAVI